MLYFEIKKVFSKPKNKIAILLLLVLLIITSTLTINKVWYVDENGNDTTGIQAAKKLREEKNKWKGYITEDVLSEVVNEYAQINQSNEAQSDDIQEQNKAYSKKQPASTIADLIIHAFSEWRGYNYFIINSISAEDARHVYEKRISNLKDWLDSGDETFSDPQKEFLIRQYEELDTPFYYEYLDGWSALLQSISTFILILALIIGFLVSGIFSDEFLTKADSIFFSARLGRNKAIISKMTAGLLITTVFYIVFVLLYTLAVLLVLGMDGANCPIQLDLWRSIYHITMFQAYLLIVGGGYIGTLLAAILAMLASAATRSTSTAIIVPFIILCALPFLSRIITLPGILSFFPDQLLDVYNSIKDFELVEFGRKVTDIVTVIILVYTIVCLLLSPVLYIAYKKTEIK